MKQSTISIRVIEPREGFYLTKKVWNEGEDRVFSTKVILSALDSPDNWREATLEEKEEWENKLKEIEEFIE